MSELGFLRNPVLTNLSAFGDLRSIEGDLTIEENDSLTTLADLYALEWVGGNLSIQDNLSLSESAIDAFLATLGEDNVGGTITISGNAP